MDTHTSSRRALKLAQEQEVAEEPKNERDRAQHAAETSEQRSEIAKGDQGRTRHPGQTASEKQATSQWKSTCERGAEIPEKRETRNGSSAIRHFEQGDET